MAISTRRFWPRLLALSRKRHPCVRRFCGHTALHASRTTPRTLARIRPLDRPLCTGFSNAIGSIVPTPPPPRFKSFGNCPTSLTSKTTSSPSTLTPKRSNSTRHNCSRRYQRAHRSHPKSDPTFQPCHSLPLHQHSPRHHRWPHRRARHLVCPGTPPGHTPALPAEH